MKDNCCKKEKLTDDTIVCFDQVVKKHYKSFYKKQPKSCDLLYFTVDQIVLTEMKRLNEEGKARYCKDNNKFANSMRQKASESLMFLENIQKRATITSQKIDKHCLFYFLHNKKPSDNSAAYQMLLSIKPSFKAITCEDMEALLKKKVWPSNTTPL